MAKTMRTPTKKIDHGKMCYVIALKKGSQAFETLNELKNYCRQNKLRYVYEKHTTANKREYYYYKEIN